MAASICKARILRFRCMLLRREDKAQAIRNTSFPSTVISYRKQQSTGSPLPASVMNEFPANKVHLQPIGNWVWSKGEIHPFHAERGGVGGGGTSEK